jgi:hypothetical protein
MNFKNKKKMQSIVSIAGFLSILMLCTMNHASPHMRLITGGVLTIIALLAFICTMCIQKLRKVAGIMFICFLMPAVATLGTYLDLKNVDSKFLLIIAAILSISLAIVSYRIADKSGNTELIIQVKKGIMIFTISGVVLLLMLIIVKVFN